MVGVMSIRSSFTRSSRDRARWRGRRWAVVTGSVPGRDWASSPALQDRLDAPVGEGADGEGPGAGGLQALVPVAATEAHDAEARAEALLGMGPATP